MEFRRVLFRSIGKFPVVTLEAARVRALAKLAETARDGAPQAVIAAAKPNGGKPLTVRAFADGDYRAFLIAKKARNRDTAQARVDEAIARTLRILGDLAGWHLSDITRRSEEHTSELQSLMRNSYAAFCSKKKKNNKQRQTH